MNNKQVFKKILWAFLLVTLTACGFDPKVDGDISIRAFSLEARHHGIYLFNSKANSIEEMRLITPEELGAGYYSWSLDGDKLLFSCQKEEEWSGICRIDKDGEDFEILLTGDEFIFNPFALSPDNRLIAFRKFTQTAPRMDSILIYDIEEGKINELFKFYDVIDSISWSPDGNQLALTINPLEVHILNINTLELKYLTNGYYPIWSPDGKSIAFTLSGTLKLFSLDEGLLETIIDPSENHKGICVNGRDGITWSHDGEYIAFINSCEEADPNLGLYMVHVDSGKVYQLHNWGSSKGALTQPVWIP
ncbi:MAG: hypothetical protein OEY93_08565 [Anaerolineae bacterium]|nr:hypothetical protein [Anaerolineae bacterium]